MKFNLIYIDGRTQEMGLPDNIGGMPLIKLIHDQMSKPDARGGARIRWVGDRAVTMDWDRPFDVGKTITTHGGPWARASDT